MRSTRRTTIRGLAAGTVLGLAGCAASEESQGPPVTQDVRFSEQEYGYTHVQPTGNRVLAGAGELTDTKAVEITISDSPAWLAALPSPEGSYWTITTQSGTTQTVEITDGSVTRVAKHQQLLEGTPPVTTLAEENVTLVDRSLDVSALSHPVPLENGSLFVTKEGVLTLETGDGTEQFDVGAPPDARIIRVDDDRYALLGDRTERYKHGALGDKIEGGSLVIVDAAAGELVTRTEIESPAVVEGTAPLVADVDGDENPEIILTLADSDDGARIAVFDQDGTRRATGPIHGSGWRHQLCVAPFAADGTRELAVVRKPHVEHVLEFYRLDDDELSVEAEKDGFRSHTYGSRNLDGGLAADLDSDGQVELLVPTTDRETLQAVRRTSSGTEMPWTLSLDGELQTNVTGVTLADGRVAVGAGTDGSVRVWQG